MSYNSFGHLFRITTWGESHGPAIGCVVDGCPPGIKLTEADIQAYLDKRRPGQSRYTTQRQEPDRVRILSGVFPDEATGAQVTTGTPISLEVENVDARSKDYGEIKDKFRPGHADYTYFAKYGVRDWRGSGRASARETAMRVAAGAIARKVVGAEMRVRGALVQIGPHKIDRARLAVGRGREEPILLVPIPPRLRCGPSFSTRCARRAHRPAPSSRSWPTACRLGLARRSTASSTRTSRAAS